MVPVSSSKDVRPEDYVVLTNRTLARVVEVLPHGQVKATLTNMYKVEGGYSNQAILAPVTYWAVKKLL